MIYAISFVFALVVVAGTLLSAKRLAELGPQLDARSSNTPIGEEKLADVDSEEYVARARERAKQARVERQELEDSLARLREALRSTVDFRSAEKAELNKSLHAELSQADAERRFASLVLWDQYVESNPPVPFDKAGAKIVKIGDYRKNS